RAGFSCARGGSRRPPQTSPGGFWEFSADLSIPMPNDDLTQHAGPGIGGDLVLHAPPAHGGLLDIAEDEVFHNEADQDHGEETREHRGDFEHVLVLVDVPTKPALPGGDTKHQLRGTQCPPSEGPPDLE